MRANLQLSVIAITLLAVLAGFWQLKPQTELTASPSPQITKYTDGDTIWLDGVKYRLHGIDAPEPRKDNAKCDAEVALGIAASEFVEEITAGAAIKITHSYYTDRYQRAVVDISINGRDWGEWLVSAGHAAWWDFDGGEPKPDWCK